MVRETLTLTYTIARRIVVLVVGTGVLLVGLAMLVLPGPAILVIPAALGILALEFSWARRWLRGARRGVITVTDGLRRRWSCNVSRSLGAT